MQSAPPQIAVSTAQLLDSAERKDPNDLVQEQAGGRRLSAGRLCNSTLAPSSKTDALGSYGNGGVFAEGQISAAMTGALPETGYSCWPKASRRTELDSDAFRTAPT